MANQENNGELNQDITGKACFVDDAGREAGSGNFSVRLLWVISFLLLAALLLASPVMVQAEALTSDGHPYDAAAEAQRQEEPVQSNEIENWPAGPVTSAGSAILMDVNTGTVFYAKNIHERMYPASTTKLLTCLIAVEHLDLNDTVTFSEEAVNSVPADGSNIGMDAGQTITVEQCLYGILVGSANECANAIAEKTAGSISAFADMMNEKAAELGCTDSHFANANGLFDENHYTSAHDLCLIGKAFFQNDILINIGCTPRYHFVATATQPDDFWIVNKHGLINGDYSYSGILGGKTGYTSQSKETLVTGCQRGNMRLVCVVMMEDAPKQFEDTISLFDYGFSNFSLEDAAESDTKYTVSTAGFLASGKDILGNSTPAFSITAGSYVDVPSTTTFDQLTSSIGDDNVITYTVNDLPAEDTRNAVVGTAGLVLGSSRSAGQSTSESGSSTTSSDSADDGNSTGTAAADTGDESSTSTTSSNIGGGNGTSAGNNSVSAFLRSIREKYYTVGLNGTIYINVVTFTATLIVLILLIVIISCARAAAARRRNSRRRKVKNRIRRNAQYDRRYHRGDSAGGGRRTGGRRYRDDDYIDHYYERPDHFSDDDYY